MEGRGRGGRGRGYLPGRGGRGRISPSSQPGPSSPTPFVPLALSSLTLEDPPPPQQASPLSEALSMSPLFEFSHVWMDLGRVIPPEFEGFLASPPGMRYLRAMDERFVRLRAAGEQPRRWDETARYLANTDELRYHLDNVTVRWRQEFMDSALANTDTVNTPWFGAVYRAMGSPYEQPPKDLEPLYKLLLMRYAKPVVRADDGRRIDPYYINLLGQPIPGWVALYTTQTNTVSDWLVRYLLGGDRDVNTTYVVDGTNLFYEFDPIKWPARELYQDRNGEYGPVVVFMKNHMVQSKFFQWEMGPTYMYNALQHMHGGIRHGHDVFVVAIEVKSCDHIRGERKRCIQYKKQTEEEARRIQVDSDSKERRRCRIIGDSGQVVANYDHLLCEYDDVAANIFVDHLQEVFDQVNQTDGGQRDAVIVTDEKMQTFIKTPDQIGYMTAAMLAMWQNIETRIFQLKPVMSRGGRVSP